MIGYALPRVLHVLAVIVWIGGVLFVTTTLLPAVRTIASPADRLRLFEEVEGRFARQARVSTALAGATGFWLVHRLGAWGWFLESNRSLTTAAGAVAGAHGWLLL